MSHRILPLIRDIRAIPQIEDISLTTNGALLPKLAPALKGAGLDRVNISLDTLDPAQFSAITRLGRLAQTLDGIDAALAFGFDPVKVNCVVVRRLNQDVFELAMLSLERPVHVRFIEYMPIGNEEMVPDWARTTWRRTPLRADPRRRIPIAPEASTPPCGMQATPSRPLSCATASRRRRWQRVSARWSRPERVPARQALGRRPTALPGAAGTVGFISAMSNHFCSSCNRMRLTADGAIRPCLFSDAEYRVREALRSGDDAAVAAVWHDAVAHKPQEHQAIEGNEVCVP